MQSCLFLAEVYLVCLWPPIHRQMHEGKKNPLMLNSVQLKFLNFFSFRFFRVILLQTAVYQVGKYNLILIDDLENVYRKMLIILCTVLKFCGDIMVISNSHAVGFAFCHV